MDNQKFKPPTEEELKNIVELGKDYNPSWKHYGKRMQVTCDHCKRPTLISRGLGTRDLCPNCVKLLKIKLTPPTVESTPEISQN